MKITLMRSEWSRKWELRAGSWRKNSLSQKVNLLWNFHAIRLNYIPLTCDIIFSGISDRATAREQIMLSWWQALGATSTVSWALRLSKYARRISLLPKSGIFIIHDIEIQSRLTFFHHISLYLSKTTQMARNSRLNSTERKDLSPNCNEGCYLKH